jgi:hypothetical protein
MNKICRCILLLVAAFTFISPVIRSEQPQKASHPSQEDRIKKLEDRADATEKAAAAAAMEKDYIARTQKLYESYYQKTFNTQMWTLGIVGILLTAVFGLVAKLSLETFEQRTKLATADATAQMRNEHGRILAKEVQKLWDSNAADTKKLKETLTAQIAVLEQNLKDRSEFEIQFVHGLVGTAEDHHDHSVANFRQALTAYKSSKTRNLIETKLGATTVRLIFEALRKKHGENFEEKAREELADPLYNGLEEELALTALQSPWLAPLITERSPAVPEPPAPEAANDPRPVTPTPEVLHQRFESAEQFVTVDEESDSCRLISS